MLTVELVTQRVVDIASVVDDNEAAHAKADALFDEVLTAIAAGHPDAQALAAAALRVNDLAFEWYTS